MVFGRKRSSEEEPVADENVEVDGNFQYPMDGTNAQMYEHPSQGFIMHDRSEEQDLDVGEDSVSRLYHILIDGQPSNANRAGGGMYESNTEVQLKREHIEKTWNNVRKWFDSHPNEEERREAAYVRGDGDETPLHLMCKLLSPPVDCVQMLLEAAIEVASWADTAGGWLPLHLACASCASPEVLELLIEAYPQGKITQDHQNRTPLHFCATHPLSSVVVLEELSNTGAAHLADRGGMLPMHYACAYGTNSDVLKVLAHAYAGGVTAREQKGRTPMHLAMSNAQRGFNSGVIQFLIEYGGKDIVNMRDNDGYLPLQLLVQGLGMGSAVPSNKEQVEEHRKNICECLKLYLDAEPEASADFLTALQDLPSWAGDFAVIQPKVRKILNQKIISRFHTCILMLDGYLLLVMIACFEICTRIAIDNRYGGADRPQNYAALSVLLLGVTYFILRELIQVISLITLGNFTSWFEDFTNWLDMTVIVTVSYFGILMFGEDDWGANPEGDAFRIGVTCTKGLLWSAVIYYLKSTLVDFAVFVGGVFYVVERLIAFLMAVVILLLMFAEMYFFIYKAEDICTRAFEQSFFNGSQILGDPGANDTNFTLNCNVLTNYSFKEHEEGDPLPEIVYSNETGGTITNYSYGDYTWIEDNSTEEAWLLDPYGEFQSIDTCTCPIYPHCTPKDSMIKVYAMMMGEVGSEARYMTSTTSQILYVLYVFIVVILLSNVLIAIVTDLYEIIQNDRAAVVFWQNRLDFVSEMDAIVYGVKNRLSFLWCGKLDDEENGEKTDDYNKQDEDDYLGAIWKDITDFLKDSDDTFEEENQVSCTDIEFYTYHLYRITTLFLIPIWLLAGVFTAGWLWPPQVRRYLFAQQEAVTSRAEMERKKLEQLKFISTDINDIREEVQYDMEVDRDDIATIRNDIDIFQGEVLQDLLQIKELMSTLLDINNAR